MKLIRQNDEAGGLVLTQNLAGKARKQNYIFGNGFLIGSSTSHIVDIPISLYVSDPFTIVFYAKRKTISSVSNIPFLRANGDQNTFWVGVRATTQPDFAVFWSGTTAFTFQKYHIGGTYNLSNFRHISNLNVPTTLNGVLSNAITYIRIGVPTIGHSLVMNNLRIYNRVLSDEELLHINNEKLGNDPISTMGMVREFPMNLFEILNTGGSDFVGFRETVSNSHVEIAGLPAGTIEEKLAFANSNLIGQW